MRYFDLTDPRAIRKLELQRAGTQILRQDAQRRKRKPAPPPNSRATISEPPHARGWHRGLSSLRTLMKARA